MFVLQGVVIPCIICAKFHYYSFGYTITRKYFMITTSKVSPHLKCGSKADGHPFQEVHLCLQRNKVEHHLPALFATVRSLRETSPQQPHSDNITQVNSNVYWLLLRHSLHLSQSGHANEGTEQKGGNGRTERLWCHQAGNVLKWLQTVRFQRVQKYTLNNNGTKISLNLLSRNTGGMATCLLDQAREKNKGKSIEV